MNKITEFRGDYRFLSNFWMCAVIYDGLQYSSSEHAYQAAKTLDPEVRLVIRNLAKARDAKKMGGALALRPDWESVKISIMEEIVTDKFTRNYHLGDKLIATGDAELVEGNTRRDVFWGVCNGVGENHLGKILMRVREKLRQVQIETA